MSKRWIEKTILAGFCISLGCMAFLCSPDKFIGSVLFSVGLLAVVVHKFSLFTGTVCSVKKSKEAVVDQLGILYGNIVGVMIAAIVFRCSHIEVPVETLVATKLSAPYLAVFAKAILCNALICLAVDEWKKQRSALMVILAVTVFVLCGFEHCVANVFYMLLAGNFSLGFFVANVVGNACGGIFLWRLKYTWRWLDEY